MAQKSQIYLTILVSLVTLVTLPLLGIIFADLRFDAQRERDLQYQRHQEQREWNVKVVSKLDGLASTPTKINGLERRAGNLETRVDRLTGKVSTLERAIN